MLHGYSVITELSLQTSIIAKNNLCLHFKTAEARQFLPIFNSAQIHIAVQNKV